MTTMNDSTGEDRKGPQTIEDEALDAAIGGTAGVGGPTGQSQAQQQQIDALQAATAGATKGGQAGNPLFKGLQTKTF